jgi:hypothetical protein
VIAATVAARPAERHVGWMGKTLPESASRRNRAFLPFALAVIFSTAIARAFCGQVETPGVAQMRQKQQNPLPSTAPPPEPRPGADETPLPLPRPDEGMAPAEPSLEIPPRPETSPAEEAACRQRLSALGARFEERPPISDPSGCAIPHPIMLTDLGGGIGIQPGALLNCTIAEALARFLTGTATKLAKEELGNPLKSISQASGYVCRPRNGTLKLSEHAFGNAIDIAGFTLSDGTLIDVDAARNPQHSQFLSKLRTAACGPFSTVLGPGSDTDHARHFHLDLAKRRNGATFCH